MFLDKIYKNAFMSNNNHWFEIDNIEDFRYMENNFNT